MGLLDIFDTDQGRLAMGLLSAAGPSREPLSLGQRLFGAMQGFDQYRNQKADRATAEEERKRRAAMQDLQMRQITEAMRQAQEQRAAQAAAMQKRNSYLDAVNPAAGPAMPVSPASGLSAGLGMDEIKALMPQEAKPKTFTLKPGETVYSETGQQLFGVPDKPDKPPTSVQEFNYAQGNPDFLKFMRDMANLKAPKTQVNVSTEKPLLNTIATGLGGQIDASLSNAKGAVGAIGTAQAIKEAVDSGKVIAGPGASFRVAGLQLGQILGVGGNGAAEVLANTRKVIQSMAKAELDAAQQMNGQGQITEAERSIIRRAASGSIDELTTPEIRLLADAMEKTGRAKIAAHNANLRKLSEIPAAAPLLPFYQVDEPQAYAPQVPGSNVRRYNPLTGRLE